MLSLECLALVLVVAVNALACGGAADEASTRTVEGFTIERAHSDGGVVGVRASVWDLGAQKWVPLDGPGAFNLDEESWYAAPIPGKGSYAVQVTAGAVDVTSFSNDGTIMKARCVRVGDDALHWGASIPLEDVKIEVLGLDHASCSFDGRPTPFQL